MGCSHSQMAAVKSSRQHKLHKQTVTTSQNLTVMNIILCFLLVYYKVYRNLWEL